jgi:outer membrane immunogenic protein
MKKLATAIAAIALIGTPAFAADMAVKAPPPTPAPVPYSWTGFYVGANGGYAWHDQTVTFAGNDFLSRINTCGGNLGGTCAPPISFDIQGGLGGLQGGYNWQFNPTWLLGIEADFDWADINGTGSNNFTMAGAPTPNAASFVANQEVESFGTVRARLGYLPTDRTLLYATGGFAYGHVKENVALNSTPNGGGFSDGTHGYICVSNTNCFLGSGSRTATGWTAGAGVEYAFWNNFTLRLEYLFVSLDGNIVNVVAQTPPGGNVPSSFSANFSRTDFNVVRGGLNYRF